MKLLIIGCGRVGSELALSTAQDGHDVTVIDPINQAFERLGTDFPGRTVCGAYLDKNVLQRAGIEESDGLAAVTNDDSVNFVIAQAAKEIFNISNVVARAYDPLRRQAFEALGIHVVASSAWGAQRIIQILTHPGEDLITTLGHGEVMLVERQIEEALDGTTVFDAQKEDQSYIVAIIRGGKAYLPNPGFILQKNDLIVVSITSKDFSNSKIEEA